MKKLLTILLLGVITYGCDVTYVPDSIYDNRTYVPTYRYPMYYPYMYYNPYINYLYYPRYYYRPVVPNPYPKPGHYGPRRGR